MSKKNQKKFFVGVCLLVMFIAWTIVLRFVDVGPIGPRGSKVGFSGINKLVHNLIGVNMKLYTITDWLGLIPICFIIGFGVGGLIQWIKRKKLFMVDKSILALGVFYVIVMAVYIFFEEIPINQRPVLINRVLETSYPSSTTMLVICVMTTAMMQFDERIRNNPLRLVIKLIIIAFIVFMILGRVLSGVHWISDVVGGLLFSTGSVVIYDCFR